MGEAEDDTEECDRSDCRHPPRLWQPKEDTRSDHADQEQAPELACPRLRSAAPVERGTKRPPVLDGPMLRALGGLLMERLLVFHRTILEAAARCLARVRALRKPGAAITVPS